MLNQEHDYGIVTIDGKDEVITSTNYRLLMKNDNRELRKEIEATHKMSPKKTKADYKSVLNEINKKFIREENE